MSLHSPSLTFSGRSHDLPLPFMTFSHVWQASLEADAIHFVQPDFHDPTTLHLGFTHKRHMRNLVVQVRHTPHDLACPGLA